MAKKESTLTNMVISLFTITLIASASLGAVYEVTKGPIADALLAKKNEAILFVIPEFTNNPTDDVYSVETDGDLLLFYPGYKDGELVGTAVESFTNSGFSGKIKVMVGFLPDGSINNYRVLEHTETPGLGTKMEPWFRDEAGKRSVLGLNPGMSNITVSKDGGEVDAITAATISSRAFLDAIQRAYDNLRKAE